MSAPGKSTIPSITGYPMIDTGLRLAIYGAAVAAAAWTLSWLSVHHYQSKYITSDVLVEIIVPLFVAAAMFVWSLVSKWNLIWAFVEKTLEAAQKGIVPPSVQQVATASQAQQIREVNSSAIEDHQLTR